VYTHSCAGAVLEWGRDAHRQLGGTTLFRQLDQGVQVEPGIDGQARRERRREAAFDQPLSPPDTSPTALTLLAELCSHKFFCVAA
jgi:hypothetical protein